MSYQFEPTLIRVLNELTDVPGPENLADRALTGARRRRRAHAALTGFAAFAVAGVLAVPWVLQSRGTAPVLETGAGAAPTQQCQVQFEMENGRPIKPADWPQFVRLTVGLLPQRTDYVVQAGRGFCNFEPSTDPHRLVLASANAFIHLGPNGEHGAVQVVLTTPTKWVKKPTTCQAIRDAIAAPPSRPGPSARPGGNHPEVYFQLESCTDGTGATPMVVVYRKQTGNGVAVFATYADRREVSLQSTGPSEQLTIGVEELRRVATDRSLVELLPVP